MKNGLNFNSILFIVFLSFVSIWTNAEQPPATSDQGASIESLKKDIRKTPENSQLIVPLAEQLYKKGEYSKVTALLWKHVDKIDSQGLALLAKAHEKKGEGSEVVRAANLLIGKDSKNPEGHTYKGIGFLLQKKKPDALASFQEALELNSKYEPAYNGLITLYEKQNPPNLYELRILYQDMVQNIGPRPQYLTKICEINYQDGVFENALNSCKEAIQKDGKIASNHVYLALSYKVTGREEESLRTLKKSAEIFKDSELAQYEYAKYLEDNKNFIDAMKFYKTATNADNKSARSWLGLASSSFELKKFEVSLIAYKNACRLDRKNAAAFRRATGLLRNSRNAEWIGKFESASDNCGF